MSRVSRQIAFLSDNIDIAVEYILLNRYIGGQSTEYSNAGLSGPVGALPGFADIKLKLFCFITIVLFKRLCPGMGENYLSALLCFLRPCRAQLTAAVLLK